MNTAVREYLDILWNYMRLGMEITPGDCIVGFGCINDDIALRCAQLYRDGCAPKVLFSGGLGRNTLGRWSLSEAERFAAIAVEHGVPRGDILLENKSTNSAENILFSRRILAQAGLDQGRLICVHKPFMERRLKAAMGVYWPEANAIYTSPLLGPEEYISRTMAQGMTEKAVIDVLVGDFQRLDVYAKKGYQLPQEIPGECWAAFEKLVELGYTGELVT